MTVINTTVLEVLKMNEHLICDECKMIGFHKMSCDSKGRRDTIKTPPTYREIENKLIKLEKEHEILGKRYDSLVKLIRKQGKDKVDDGDKFLRNYAKDYD